MAHTHTQACIHNTRHIHNARRILRGDPTRTLGISRRFIADINRRQRKLNKAVFNLIVTLDAFGLKPRKEISFIGNVEPGEYRFRTDANKQATFAFWFENQVQAGKLNISESGKYVESAHKQGIANAFLSSKAADTADTLGVGDATVEEYLRSSFLLPETIQKIESLSTRTFESLKGYNTAMANQTSRIMAQGLADGHSPRTIARQMTDAMNTLTKNQAHTIARTEIINAHANGQLDTFDNLGVTELGVKAEWLTAGDDRVCPDCQGQEGVIFSIDEARGLIPFHPNCRCTWIPYVPEKGVKAPQQKTRAQVVAEAKARRGSRTRRTTPTPPPVAKTALQKTIEANEIAAAKAAAKKAANKAAAEKAARKEAAAKKAAAKKAAPVAKPTEIIPEPRRYRDVTDGLGPVSVQQGQASREAIKEAYQELGEQMKPSGMLPPGTNARSSLRDYQGSTYHDINGALWRGNFSAVEDYIEDHVKNLDSLFRAQSVKEDLMVFRGTKFDADLIKPGAIIEERGFVSTTLHPSITDSFADGAQLAVRVPKGTPAVHMDRNMGQFNHEYEIVLNRGSKYHVTGETITKTIQHGVGDAARLEKVIFHVVELIPDNM